MTQEIAVKKKGRKQEKWDDASLLAMSKTDDVRKMRELFPVYDSAEIGNDLLAMVRLSEGTEHADEASRLASTILIRTLPLIEQAIYKKRKWRGTTWFDGAVVVAAFGAVLYLLNAVGVIVFV